MKYGFLSLSGKLETDFIYDEALPYVNGKAIVRRGATREILTTEGQTTLINCDLDSIDCFSCSRAVFSRGEKYGILNDEGEVLTEPSFDYLHRFADGLALFDSNSKRGYLNLNGNVQIEALYSRASNFSSGLASVKRDDEYYFIGKNGNLELGPYYEADSFDHDIAVVQKKESSEPCVIDRSGAELFPAHSISSYGSGFLIQRISDGEWALLNRNGQKLFQRSCDQLFGPHDQLCMFKVNGKYGYLNLDGEEIIAANLQDAVFFKNGIAFESLKGSTRFFNTVGETLFELPYFVQYHLSEGRFVVHLID